MNYLIWALIHIGGVFAFQYYGVLWFLLPGTLHVMFSLAVFVFGVSAALTPIFQVEKLDGEKHKEYGSRFLMQAGSILTSAQLFMIGYEFFAGAAILHSTVLALAVIMQKLFDKE